MSKFAEDLLLLAETQDNGFTSRDMKELMEPLGYASSTNSVSASLHQLHASQHVFFLKKKEGSFFRYYHSKYRGNFSPDERHDLPLPQSNWVNMSQELATALLLSIQGDLSRAYAKDLLKRYDKMREKYDG
jgi:hypothetical protein